MDKKSQILSFLQLVGMLVLLFSAFLPLLHVNSPLLRYFFAAGAAMTFIAQLLNKYHGKNFTIKRLYRILTVSSICYCASAFLLFYSTTEKDWLAFLTAGAVLQVYASFRIQYLESKEAQKGNKA